jgi:hypothetical protein
MYQGELNAAGEIEQLALGKRIVAVDSVPNAVVYPGRSVVAEEIYSAAGSFVGLIGFIGAGHEIVE